MKDHHNIYNPKKVPYLVPGTSVGWLGSPSDGKKRQSFNRPIAKSATGRYKPVNVLLRLDWFDVLCLNTLHKVAYVGLPSESCCPE